MSRIRPSWTPPNTGGNSTDQEVLGVDVQSDIPITISGVWWYHTGANLPATVRARLWVTSGPTSVADSGTLSTAGFTANAWNLVSFSGSYSAAASTTYTASVFDGTGGTYGYSTSDLASDIFDVSGHVKMVANTGRFLGASGDVFPTSIFPGGGAFGVDIEFTPSAAEATPGPLIAPSPAAIRASTW